VVVVRVMLDYGTLHLPHASPYFESLGMERISGAEGFDSRRRFAMAAGTGRRCVGNGDLAALDEVFARMIDSRTVLGHRERGNEAFQV
jgi:hypothetical protein